MRTIPTLSFLILCFCWAFGGILPAKDKPAAHEWPREKLHVYLLIGQSNMAGRAPFTPEESGAIGRCYLLNGDDLWEPAKNPFNRYSTIRKGLGMQKMNPGYGFARTMLARNKDIAIGLVVNAKGGTSIRQWAKGSQFYKEALRRTELARKTGTLKGILWHQGETDATDEHYLEKMKLLIGDLRKDLSEPELPFIAGQINNVPLINNQIGELPQSVPFTGYASADGLKAMDRWHFNAESMKLLGQRYAEAVLRVQEQAGQGASGGRGR